MLLKSLPAISAGFVAVLVGFASSVAIVFQAAASAGADQAVLNSWLLALGLALGLTGISLSWYFRMPVLTAWSTPGAALLVSSLQGFSLAEATGAFMLSAAISLVLALTGWFDSLSRRIPLPVASAMLAGILFNFGVALFSGLQQDFVLVLGMLLCFLISKEYWPRYATVLTLVVALIYVSLTGQFQPGELSLSWPKPVWVSPEWSLAALMGVAIPLCIVTMTSQNIPGLAVLQSAGYQVPARPVLAGCALSNLLLAPLGAFSVNLAAITAAICASPEANPDPAQRYKAAIAAGVFYLLSGLCGAAVVALFLALPAVLVSAIAGLALLGTINSNLGASLQPGPAREAGLITLLLTVSGINFFGINSAFWGLIAGLAVYTLQQCIQRRKTA
ncbi:benzoate/H(+) symporter BenE family transporter [Rheinheimera marina]|uniref:Benzoate/H(+) symporter BenE family transporter n=1 Tax=Rheinheimera marina TaxID=1774958 RepID=A0ABV9JIF9_9GAMM